MNINEARKRGHYVTTSTGTRIHSQYDPVREARRRLPEEPPGHARYVVLGAGLGYVLDALIQLNQNVDVLVAEPHPELLDRGRDRSIWSPDPFEFFEVIGPDHEDPTNTIGSFISPLNYAELELINWSDYEENHQEFFRDTLECLQRVQETHEKSAHVLESQGVTWLKHMRQNLSRIDDHHTPAVDTLGGSAALVSAGPSLDYQLDWLRRHRDKVHLFVGNTAGPILRHYDDLQADVHVAMDANAPVVDDCRRSRIQRLMVSPFVNPSILNEATRSFTLMGVETPLTGWLTDSPFLPTVQPGGAISATTLSWLSRHSLRNIYLLGCDMDFRFGRYYARGTGREQDAQNGLNRFSSLPGWHIDQYTSRDGEQRLGNEREWFRERARSMDQLVVPGHAPEWWNGRVENGGPNGPAPDPLQWRRPDESAVQQWLDHQYEQFTEVRSGRDTSPEWSRFYDWVERLCSNPEHELDQWDQLFTSLLSG